MLTPNFAKSKIEERNALKNSFNGTVIYLDKEGCFTNLELIKEENKDKPIYLALEGSDDLEDISNAFKQLPTSTEAKYPHQVGMKGGMLIFGKDVTTLVTEFLQRLNQSNKPKM